MHQKKVKMLTDHGIREKMTLKGKGCSVSILLKHACFPFNLELSIKLTTLILGKFLLTRLGVFPP